MNVVRSSETLETDTLERFPSVAALIENSDGERPVQCIRPEGLRAAAKAFLTGFPGETLFAVKCNAHPAVLGTLADAGIHCWDVASEPEIASAHAASPDGTLFFHHPVKTPRAIRNAYENWGVQHYTVDCADELAKVLANTGADAFATVRLSVPQDNAVYDLSTKFGTTVERATQLLASAHAAGRKVGVSFHVGSQCLSPESYSKGMRMALDAGKAAGVHLSHINVGGGFPGYYATTACPPWEDYFAHITDKAKELDISSETRLMCEPGRALVYNAGSLLTRVLLRKDDCLYLNDGIFGGFAEIYWGGAALTLRHTVHGHKGGAGGETKPFLVYGPTCDGNDKLPYKVDLPVGITDGDWIEFHQLGAYGREMSTTYNGLGARRIVVIDEKPPVFA